MVGRAVPLCSLQSRSFATRNIDETAHISFLVRLQKLTIEPGNMNFDFLAEAGAVLEATKSRIHQTNNEKCLALRVGLNPLVVDSYGTWGREVSA